MQVDNDDSDDGFYTKRKTMKGDALYAEYLASQDPSNAFPQPESNRSGKGTKAGHETESDKKPAAKVRIYSSYLIYYVASFEQ
jgi:hypothetical protein